MLVDGAVRFSKIAREALVEKDIKKSHEYLIKVQDIFTELMVSLDQSAGEWAKQIYQVYEFIKMRLFEINLKKDVKMMDELMPLIENIRDTWYEAYESLKKINK